MYHFLLALCDADICHTVTFIRFLISWGTDEETSIKLNDLTHYVPVMSCALIIGSSTWHKIITWTSDDLSSVESTKTLWMKVWWMCKRFWFQNRKKMFFLNWQIYCSVLSGLDVQKLLHHYYLIISMSFRKTAVSPLLMHWRYQSLNQTIIASHYYPSSHRWLSARLQ